MGRFFKLLFVLFMLSACSTNDAVIPVQTSESDITSSNVTDIDEEEVIEKYAEFVVGEESISIAIHEIPILYEYLQVQKSPQQALREMELEKYEAGQEVFYLLEFSCHNEHCSYLILHPDKKKNAFLLADMAKHITHHVSYDETKLAFQFNRLGNQNIPLSHVVVFDLKSWTPLELTVDSEVGHMLRYKWPIISVVWLENDILAIHFPALLHIDEDAWKDWSSIEKNAQNTILYKLKQD